MKRDQTNAEINEIKESTKWLKEQIDILWGFAHGQTLVLEKHTKNFKEDAEDLFAEQRRQIAGLTDLVNTLQKEMQATKKQADATAVELENVKKAVGDCNTRISKLEKAGKAVSSVVSKLKKALTGAKSQEADVSEVGFSQPLPPATWFKMLTKYCNSCALKSAKSTSTRRRMILRWSDL